MVQPYTIQLLGGLCVTQGAQTITRFRTQKTAVLLAYLAYHLTATHSREELIELLWPESDLDAGRTSLRTALASLRRQIEPPGVPENSVLLADRTYIRLNPEVVSTDVAAFEAALRAARQSDDPATRAQKLAQAVAHYRGPLLPGFYDDWALRERGRLEQVYLGALRDLAPAQERQGDLSAAIDTVHRLVNTDPLQEEAHGDLMRLYAANGQVAEARRQYEELKRILRRELNEAPSAEIQALAERLSGAPASRPPSARLPEPPPAAPPATAMAPPTLPFPLPEAPEAPAPPQPRLPLQLTRFFGREEEIARLETLLKGGETRLVTLTGPGGSGKTRLSVEVARRLIEPFAGYVCFVPLAEISDPRLIPGAIVDALGAPRSADRDPLEQGIETLRRQPFLLVLDNFEQVAEEGASAVWTLLERAPQLVCLVTSRHRLDLGGEQEFPVTPLPVPTMPGTPERMAEFASIRLFTDRAQAVRPDFQITRENAATIAALCERLEGIPLAIELAAAWVGALTVPQILARLEHRFDLLTSRRKDLSPRHRTLRAAIEWSYRLLPAELQQFFAKLSVFHGGWTLEAAEAVCAEPNALEYLQQLRERSLVLAEETDSGMWFRLMESLREYASEQVEEVTRKNLKTRHLQYFLRLVEGAQSQFYGPEQQQWMEVFEQQHDNLRAALQWAYGESAYIAEGLELACRLPLFWHMRGHFAEGYRRLTELLARYEVEHLSPSRPESPESRRLRATAWQGAGELAFAQGNLIAARQNLETALALWRQEGVCKGLADTLCFLGLVTDQANHAQAQALYEESLALYRELGDEGGRAHALKCLGSNAQAQGDLKQAHRLFEEGLALYRKLENPRGINMMLGELGQLALSQGDYARAESLLHESLRLSRELKDLSHAGMALTNLGHVLRNRGDYALARTVYAQSLAIFRGLGGRWGVVGALTDMGVIAMEQSDYPAARALYEEGLALARELGEQESIAHLLTNLGRIAQYQGDYTTARGQMQESLALYRQLGDSWGIATALRHLGNIATDEGDYPTAQAHYRQSLTMARDIGDKHSVAMALYNLGDIAWRHNDLAEAQTLWEECCALDQELGVKGGSVLGALGALCARRGDMAEAFRLWSLSLTEHREIGDRKGVAESLEGLAALAVTQAQLERAVRLYAAAEALRERLGVPRPTGDRADYEKRFADLRAALGDEAFQTAWARGHKMPQEDTISYALKPHF